MISGALSGVSHSRQGQRSVPGKSAKLHNVECWRGTLVKLTRQRGLPCSHGDVSEVPKLCSHHRDWLVPPEVGCRTKPARVQVWEIAVVKLILVAD